jgi:hypothetical protein
MFRVSDWLPVPHSFTQVEQAFLLRLAKEVSWVQCAAGIPPCIAWDLGRIKRPVPLREQGSSNDEEGIAVSHEIGLSLHRVVQRGGQRGLALETQFDVYRRIMEIDFFAPLRLTQSTLVARDGGAAGRAGSPWSVPSQAGLGVTAYIILLAFMSIPE